jgi:hypothetical protein
MWRNLRSAKKQRSVSGNSNVINLYKATEPKIGSTDLEDIKFDHVQFRHSEGCVDDPSLTLFKVCPEYVPSKR